MPGSQAVHDDDLGITWVANANLALTNQFGLTLSADILDDSPDTVGSTGLMTWENAQAWISGMNTANYLGFNDWRFAETLIPDNGCDGVASQGAGCSGSEMGHLFYDEFGADPNTSVLATGDPTELAKFSNLQTDDYWSGTEFVSNTGFVYMFGFDAGAQRIVIKTENHFALAVRGGAIIPIPPGM